MTIGVSTQLQSTAEGYHLLLITPTTVLMGAPK